MTHIEFADLPLAEPIQRALRDNDYQTPTPIQAMAIPPQLEGRDLIGCAQTGTGKTAAFALPMLHHISQLGKRPQRGTVRGLVLTPTRELAVQVGQSFATYGKHTRVSCAVVHGGVSQHPQARAIARGLDVLVATPGRLLDLLDQGVLDLSQVRFLVLDEVDRMLDMGFVHDVRRIAGEVSAQRQTALFTATMDKEVSKIADAFVQDPVKVSIAPETPVLEKISQTVCFVRHENKIPLLQALLRDQAQRGGQQSTIVFCRTKYGTEKLAKQLNRGGLRCDAIHGDKSQAARQRALDAFRGGKLAVLVATDVAARGIDVRTISLVVNFDLPEAPDSYVHRIGRTARADADGGAVTFCTVADHGSLAAIEKYIGKPIPVDALQPFHDTVAANRRQTHHRSRPVPRNNRYRPPHKGGNRFSRRPAKR
jgi:ATP-dependent RNA helicase RhlE